MKSRIVICLVAAACSTLAVADSVDTKDKIKDDKAAATTTSATSAPEGDMSPEMAAMMKAWEEAGTPGKPHETLKPVAGTFDVKCKAWMEKDGEPMESTGKSENKMIFGGRYLEQRFSGDFMGAPFEGIGYMGYDNVKKEYFSTWIDSMSTMMMTSTGSGDGGNVVKFTGECVDPVTGKATKARQILTVKGPNQYVFESWGTDPKTGVEFKGMELVATRVGSM